MHYVTTPTAAQLPRTLLLIHDWRTRARAIRLEGAFRVWNPRLSPRRVQVANGEQLAAQLAKYVAQNTLVCLVMDGRRNIARLGNILGMPELTDALPEGALKQQSMHLSLPWVIPRQAEMQRLADKIQADTISVHDERLEEVQTLLADLEVLRILLMGETGTERELLEQRSICSDCASASGRSAGGAGAAAAVAPPARRSPAHPASQWNPAIDAFVQALLGEDELWRD